MYHVIGVAGGAVQKPEGHSSCSPLTPRRRLPHQFRDRLAVIHDGSRATIEILDECPCCVDPQVVINRCQKISRVTDSLGRIFAPLVSRGVAQTLLQRLGSQEELGAAILQFRLS